MCSVSVAEGQVVNLHVVPDNQTSRENTGFKY